MMFRGLIGEAAGMGRVAMRHVGMVSALLVGACLVVLCRFAMVTSSVLVVLSSFGVVFSSFVGHELPPGAVEN